MADEALTLVGDSQKPSFSPDFVPPPQRHAPLESTGRELLHCSSVGNDLLMGHEINFIAFKRQNGAGQY